MKRTITHFLALCCACFSIVGYAQNAAQYGFTPIAGTYTDIAGGTPVTVIQADDQFTTGIPIGFSFNFCGTNYTTVAPSSNGWLSLGTPTGSVLGNTLANMATITPALMPLWDDLDGGGGTAVYQTTGTAPNRIFTFEWRNWWWDFTVSTPTISFQVKLYETTNIIDFIYRQEPTTPVSPDATIGIARNGTDYLNLPDASTAPIPTSSTFIDAIGAKPATGQVYRWTPPPPCTGQPVAGTANVANNCPTTLYLTGNTIALNLTYQWQKRGNCGSLIWSNIPGATNATYGIVSLNTPTDYRVVVTCTNSGMSDTSSIVNVISATPCYCTSIPTSAIDEEIYAVTINGVTNAYNCTTVAPGPGSILNRYSNFTTLGPLTTLSPGAVVPFTIVEDECDGPTYFNNGMAMWIDFNGDGDYLDAGEQVYTESATSLSPRTVNGSFTVPANAVTGITVGMRVICAEGSAGAALTPCLAYGFGETEDYLVKIAYIPSATGAGVFCSGQNDTLHATAPGLSVPYTFYWTDPQGNFIDTASTIVLSNLQTNQSGVYKLRVLTYPCTGGVGPADTSGVREIEIWVNQTPGAPQVAPVITYCQYAPFDSIQIYGQNLKWYTVPVGGTFTTVAPVINTSVYGSVTWYVSQTVNGCEGPRKAVTINVVPQSPLPTVVSPITYCQGEPSVPLQATGQNLLWYSIPTGGVGTPVTPTPGTNAQGTFTWYVSQTIAGCESARVPVEVHVNYRPNGIITVSRDFACQYDTLTLGYYGNADSSASYIWELPKGSTVLSGSGAGPLVVRFDTAGTLRVRLVVDNGGCVGPEALVDLDIRLAPVFTLDIQPDACKDDIINVAINYSTPGVDHYDWDMAGGEIVYGSFSAGPYGVRWNSAGDKVITVIATDRECKSLPVTDIVHVHDLPRADILNASSDKICAGDSILLEAYYESGYSYEWLPSQFFSEGHESRQWARVDFTRNIYLHVTDEFNCRSTDSMLIVAEPCCQVYFPTAFSPNNDGRNDVFRIISKGHHEITSFRVQNRWGQTVFETADDRKGWDGTYSGQPQDMGTYFYYIKYRCADGKFYEDKGEFVLVR